MSTNAQAPANEEPLTSAERVKVPTVLQLSAVECGAACLGMILAKWGRWVPLTTLREETGVSRDGARLSNVVTVAQSYGLETAAKRVGLRGLAKMDMPTICWWRQEHYVVLEGIRKDRFYVNDPAIGRVVYGRDEFKENFSNIAVSFSPTAEFTRGGRKFRPWPALKERLSAFRPGVAFSVIAGILATLTGVILAPLSQLFINQGLIGGDQQILVGLAVAFAIVGLIRGGLGLLEDAVVARIQAGVTLQGEAGYLDRLLRMPMMFYLQRHIGDLAQRVSYIGQVATLLGQQIASAGVSLIAAVAFAVLLIFYQPLVGILVIGFSLLSVASLRVLTRKRMVIQQQVMQRQNDLAGKSLGAFADVETIKASGREQETFAGLAGDYGKFSAARDRLSSSSALLVAVPVVIAALSTASVLIVGGYFVLSGALTLGALFAMLALATNLNAPLSAFMAAGDRISVVGTNLQALDDVLEEPVDDLFSGQRDDLVIDVDDVAGDLELRAVTFGYSRQQPPLLEDFSLVLRPGQRVALVGGSGSGKSTIANIATGLLHPWVGEVLLDQRPLLAYRAGIREQAIAKVDQSVVLFVGTIRQNVTLFDDSIPDEAVMTALADAEILEDVLARDGGLDAVVEENGRNFSGGQRQRLEIARALVREPRVVILDEATSALDEITEKRVDAALRRRGVTCLIVAHRLSTVRDADRIVVLGPGGELLEAGTHEELVGLGGRYQALISDGEADSDGH